MSKKTISFLFFFFSFTICATLAFLTSGKRNPGEFVNLIEDAKASPFRWRQEVDSTKRTLHVRAEKSRMRSMRAEYSFRSRWTLSLGTGQQHQGVYAGRIQVRRTPPASDLRVLEFKVLEDHSDNGVDLSLSELPAAYVESDERGKFIRVLLPSKATQQQVERLHSFIDRFQVVRAPKNPDTFGVTETSYYGAAHAVYSQQDGGVLEKRRSGKWERDNLPAVQLNSLAQLEMVEDEISSIAGEDDIQWMANGTPRAQLTESYEFSLIHEEPTVSHEVLANYAEVCRADRSAEAELRQAMRIAGLEPVDMALVTEAFDVLVEQFRLYPESIIEAVQFLKDYPANDNLNAIVLGAMGATNNNEAQEGLASVFTSDQFKQSTRETALVSLTQVEKPNDFLDAHLMRLVDTEPEIADVSLLQLGVVGDRVRQDKERFRRIEEYLANTARQVGSDSNELILVLEALGNLGSASSDLAVRAYGDSSDEVRASAIRSVERTHTSSADGLLLHALKRDASEDVRMEALRVLARGRNVGSAPIREALKADASPAVRLKAAAFLGARFSHEESTLSILRWVRENDPSHDVRSAAARVLELL